MNSTPKEPSPVQPSLDKAEEQQITHAIYDLKTAMAYITQLNATILALKEKVEKLQVEYDKLYTAQPYALVERTKQLRDAEQKLTQLQAHNKQQAIEIEKLQNDVAIEIVRCHDLKWHNKQLLENEEKMREKIEYALQWINEAEIEIVQANMGGDAARDFGYAIKSLREALALDQTKEKKV
jgi:predicted  nucleic acid-binding Zn-ribbon protein